MDALVQFFTTVAMVMANTAMAQIGGDAESSQTRNHKGQQERTVKRTPQPQTHIVLRLPR